jgi:predicted metal-binding membrane protein
VSTVASITGPASRIRARARRALARRPEAWAYLAAAAAGLTLVWLHVVGHHGLEAGYAGHGVPHAAATPIGSAAAWVLMVLAMMLPVIAPQARQVALRSLWSRRHRSMIWYLAGYIAVWSVTGLVALTALRAVGVGDPPAGILVGALLVAAVWQTSGPRRRVMRRCGVLRLGEPRGWPADRDCANVGVRAGIRCMATCGPVMLAMAMSHHNLFLMAAVSALLISERARGPNPGQRAGRPQEAWCLVGLAVVAGAAATL